MSKQKFYAVARGHRPGIYSAWFGEHGAEVQVKGIAGARYKGFTSRAEADAWFAEMSSQHATPSHNVKRNDTKKPIARKESRPSAHHTPKLDADVVIYSDGGCSKNPGPGGYGVIVLHGDSRRELSGGYARTTNNRMELLGCIKGLESLDQPYSVAIYTDSQYVVNGIEKGWAKKWRANNWMRTVKDAAENPDLWARLLDLCDKHSVRFHWVRGHAGHIENERCDTLAVEMTHMSDLPPDVGYNK